MAVIHGMEKGQLRRVRCCRGVQPSMALARARPGDPPQPNPALSTEPLGSSRQACGRAGGSKALAAVERRQQPAWPLGGACGVGALGWLAWAAVGRRQGWQGAAAASAGASQLALLRVCGRRGRHASNEWRAAGAVCWSAAATTGARPRRPRQRLQPAATAGSCSHPHARSRLTAAAAAAAAPAAAAAAVLVPPVLLAAPLVVRPVVVVPACARAWEARMGGHRAGQGSTDGASQPS